LLRDVPEVNGKPIRRRKRANLEPRLHRRIKVFELHGHLLAHGTLIKFFDRRPDGRGEHFPMIDAQSGLARRAKLSKNFIRPPVHKHEAPLAIQSHKRVCNAVEDVRNALVSLNEIALGAFASGQNRLRVLHRHGAQQLLLFIVEMH
jgi:hypothetical protein